MRESAAPNPRRVSIWNLGRWDRASISSWSRSVPSSGRQVHRIRRGTSRVSCATCASSLSEDPSAYCRSSRTSRRGRRRDERRSMVLMESKSRNRAMSPPESTSPRGDRGWSGKPVSKSVPRLGSCNPPGSALCLGRRLSVTRIHGQNGGAPGSELHFPHADRNPRPSPSSRACSASRVLPIPRRPLEKDHAALARKRSREGVDEQSPFSLPADGAIPPFLASDWLGSCAGRRQFSDGLSHP